MAGVPSTSRAGHGRVGHRAAAGPAPGRDASSSPPPTARWSAARRLVHAAVQHDAVGTSTCWSAPWSRRRNGRCRCRQPVDRHYPPVLALRAALQGLRLCRRGGGRARGGGQEPGSRPTGGCRGAGRSITEAGVSHALRSPSPAWGPPLRHVAEVRAGSGLGRLHRRPGARDGQYLVTVRADLAERRAPRRVAGFAVQAYPQADQRLPLDRPRPRPLGRRAGVRSRGSPPRRAIGTQRAPDRWKDRFARARGQTARTWPRRQGRQQRHAPATYSTSPATTRLRPARDEARLGHPGSPIRVTVATGATNPYVSRLVGRHEVLAGEEATFTFVSCDEANASSVERTGSRSPPSCATAARRRASSTRATATHGAPPVPRRRARCTPRWSRPVAALPEARRVLPGALAATGLARPAPSRHATAAEPPPGYYVGWPVRFGVVLDAYGNRRDAGKTASFVARVQGPLHGRLADALRRRHRPAQRGHQRRLLRAAAVGRAVRGPVHAARARRSLVNVSVHAAPTLSNRKLATCPARWPSASTRRPSRPARATAPPTGSATSATGCRHLRRGLGRRRLLARRRRAARLPERLLWPRVLLGRHRRRGTDLLRNDHAGPTTLRRRRPRRP